jgi:hypothetical protein
MERKRSTRQSRQRARRSRSSVRSPPNHVADSSLIRFVCECYSAIPVTEEHKSPAFRSQTSRRRNNHPTSHRPISSTRAISCRTRRALASSRHDVYEHPYERISHILAPRKGGDTRRISVYSDGLSKSTAPRAEVKHPNYECITYSVSPSVIPNLLRSRYLSLTWCRLLFSQSNSSEFVLDLLAYLPLFKTLSDLITHSDDTSNLSILALNARDASGAFRSCPKKTVWLIFRFSDSLLLLCLIYTYRWPTYT